MKKVLIVGATSAMAEETARCFAAQGDHLLLAARSPEKLDAVASDLKTRGASAVDIWVLDALDSDRHPAFIASVIEKAGGIDIALIAHGTLSDQPSCEADYALAEKEFRTNFLSVVSLLTPVDIFETVRQTRPWPRNQAKARLNLADYAEGPLRR